MNQRYKITAIMHTCENINPINTKKLASSSYVVNLEKELKQARADIAELREENRILKIEISRQTTYTQVIKLLEEEIQFRRQADCNMQQLLANFELINRKLRTKIDKLEHENLPTLSKQASSTIDSIVRVNESFEEDSQQGKPNRHKRSQSGESHKSNHPITPKSRIHFDLCAVLEGELALPKKKVFL